MVGVAERGVMTLWLTAREGGGHASTPPAFPATARLARAIDRLHRHPFPDAPRAAGARDARDVAPHAPQPLRAVFRNLALTGPLVAAVFAQLGPETNAIVRTTAVATQLSGAPGENVLATTATRGGQHPAADGRHRRAAPSSARAASIADPAIELEVRHGVGPVAGLAVEGRGVAAHRGGRRRRRSARTS